MQDIRDVDHTLFNEGTQNEADKVLLVKFFFKAMLDKEKSTEQQRAVYKDRLYISITIPGSREDTVRVAHAGDLDRFPEHYARFKNRVEEPTEGTPLKEWPMITRSLAEELSFLNIKTVEQLAGMTDTHAGKFMSGYQLKQDAKQWLERTKKDVTAGKLQTELAQRDETIAKMQAQIEELIVNSKPKAKAKAKAKAEWPEPKEG